MATHATSSLAVLCCAVLCCVGLWVQIPAANYPLIIGPVAKQDYYEASLWGWGPVPWGCCEASRWGFSGWGLVPTPVSDSIGPLAMDTGQGPKGRQACFCCLVAAGAAVTRRPQTGLPPPSLPPSLPPTHPRVSSSCRCGRALM